MIEGQRQTIDSESTMRDDLARSLVNTVARCGHPVLIDQSSPTPMGGREAKEGGAAYRHLPGELTVAGSGTVDYPSFIAVQHHCGL